MLEKLIETGEKIYEEISQGKKGNKLEGITWITTSLRYIECYADQSDVNDAILEMDLLECTLKADDIILVLAVLKSEQAILTLKNEKKQFDCNQNQEKTGCHVR